VVLLLSSEGNAQPFQQGSIQDMRLGLTSVKTLRWSPAFHLTT